MNEIYVEIIDTRGSAPRDAGTAMKVTMDDLQGTIGGGALEHQAIALAREMMSKAAPEVIRSYALGPNLGQCCGGSVKLRFTREKRATDVVDLTEQPLPVRRAFSDTLWIWGAGHVGRAMVHAAAPHALDITWIDDALDRFPANIPSHVNAIPAANMPLLAARAPTYAHHLIFTYSHDIDLALCAALLKCGAASIGVIGSETKWSRFSRRLHKMGLDPSPIICPIGDKSLGKNPKHIASGTIAALLQMTQQKVSA